MAPARSEPAASIGSRAPEPRTPLVARLSERIQRAGPITFAEFMETALYDPEFGFYSRPRAGEDSDFLTSPHVSPVFATLVARQVAELWQTLERPAAFQVVEVGAGDGTLAQGILAALPPDVRAAVVYTAVERSEGARARLRSAGLRALGALEEVEPSPTGCILANELLDNLPFHRLRRTETGLVELYVGADAGHFGLVEGPLSDPALEAHGAGLPPGTDGIAALEAQRFLEWCAGRFDRGLAWLVDYGFGPNEHPADALVHGYRDHRATADVLDAPGSRDITAGVDFGRLVEGAAALGLRTWGPVRQSTALIALGFRDLEARARARQGAAIDQRRGIDALRIYSARTRANMLLARPGLGDFLVLCLGIGVDHPPPSVQRAVEQEAEADGQTV